MKEIEFTSLGHNEWIAQVEIGGNCVRILNVIGTYVLACYRYENGRPVEVMAKTNHETMDKAKKAALKWLTGIDGQDPVRVLAAIADAYDANELDDEARRYWGANYEHENKVDHDKIILYTGRGGKTLLTLGDCMAAREKLKTV
jgi:hypothetical protein